MAAIGEAIVKFAKPLIDATDGSLEQVQRALIISQACWNLAVMPEKNRRPALESLRDALQMNDAEYADFEINLVRPMIRRHEEMFPGLHGFEPCEPLHWVASAAPTSKNRVREEKPAAPRRYDPCPCGSGKKYKFCCGKGPG
jgi:uncharacterized protein YecA (UPF0149 family)